MNKIDASVKLKVSENKMRVIGNYIPAYGEGTNLSVDEVMDSDSQMKMAEKEQDFDSFSLDLAEFEQEEKKPIDYTEFGVPEDAENFDPFSIAGYSVPKLEVDLEEFQEMLPEVFEEEQED